MKAVGRKEFLRYCLHSVLLEKESPRNFYNTCSGRRVTGEALIKGTNVYTALLSSGQIATGGEEENTEICGIQIRTPTKKTEIL